MARAKRVAGVEPAWRSVTPSTPSALEGEAWAGWLREEGYRVAVHRTRFSYTSRGAVQLYYVVSDAPMAVVALMLARVTPANRTGSVNDAPAPADPDGVPRGD